MASSVSSAINTYAEIERYSPDFQLLGQVLNAKQTQLNSNRNKLQDFRNQLGALDVVKDEDRTYLDQRLDQITEMSNQYANLDLSSDALTNSLIGNMGQVFDENVKAALTGTKILRNEQAEWTKMKEKDITKYSDANYAYAMQKANRWMTDGKTGTRYNGGGGFIEYASPEDTMNKNMPDAIKAATHKRQRAIAGPAGGVGGIVTEEYVDRGELQNILLSKLDAKNLRQFDIDAWAKYENKPTELLRADYENYSQPQIDEANAKIESLEAAIANTSNPDAKQTYQNSLDSYKQLKGSLENEYSFDNFMSTHGKSGVYSSLHKNQVMDKFLDAYSRDPEVVEIKVNEIDQANRTLEHQNEVFAETKAQNTISNKLKEDANKIAAYKAGLNADGTVSTAATFLPGPSVKVPTNSEENSVFTDLKTDANKLQQEAINALKAMKVSDKTARYFVTTKRFADMTINGNLAGVKFLDLDGKKLEVSKDFRNAVTHLGADHYNNPVLKQSYKEIDDMVTEAQGALSKGVLNKELALSSIPNFTIKLKAGPNNTHTVESEPKGFKENPYIVLLRKQASLKKGQQLSTTDAANLQLYGNMHLMNDGGLSPEQRAFARQRVVEQLNGLGISDKDYKKIQIKSRIEHGATIPNTLTKVEWGKDSWLTEITSGNTMTSAEQLKKDKLTRQIKDYKERIYQAADNQRSISAIPGFFGGKSLEALEDELKNLPQGVDVSQRIEVGFKTIEENIAKTITSQTKLVAGREQVLPRKGNEGVYVKLAAASGLVTTSKDDIVLIPTFDAKGKTTTVVKVKNLTTGAIGKTKVNLDTEMTADELEKLNISKWDVKGHRYNAEKGDLAPTLKLGNGNYNGLLDRGMNPTTKATLLNQIEGLPEEVTQITKQMLKDYASGLYYVQYISVGNRYRPVVVDAKGKDILPGYLGSAMLSPIIEDDEADKKLEDPKETVDQIIQDLITKTQQYTVSNL
jgi:hypothetical protein